MMSLTIFSSNVTWMIVWLVIFVIALVVELTTAQLVSIWFCGGSIAAIIFAACNLPWWAQILVFAVLSAALLVVSKVFFKQKNEEKRTNSDALIGSEILITAKVDKNIMGTGKIRDVVWSIATEEEIEILPGEYAIIESISGNHLVVKRKEI